MIWFIMTLLIMHHIDAPFSYYVVLFSRLTARLLWLLLLNMDRY